MVLRAVFAAILLFMSVDVLASGPTRSFGVLNQRSATLTAKYWNPILAYVGGKTGINLELSMGKSASETTDMTKRGKFDYIYSNHIFIPSVTKAGYRVIARPLEETIQGQIVVLDNSPIHSLHEIDGKTVGFPSANAFVGYAVPMNELLQRKIHVNSVFAGNQEGIMGQLKAGRIIAAAVNSRIMKDFAAREHFTYRILWSSETYLNLPIAASPRISAKESKRVTEAFIAMADDPVGKKILETSAAIVGQPPPYGFIRASDHDYQNYKNYYKTTLVKTFR